MRARALAVGFFVLGLSVSTPAADEGLWTWLGGGATDAAVFGTQGIPAPGNTPGASSLAPTWTDLEGNLWMMPGHAHSLTKNSLWKYVPAQNAWAWMGGAPGTSSASYGTKGVAAPSNWPGPRNSPACWTDSAGRFWLYGGLSMTRSPADLWVYETSTTLWTWMAGTSFEATPSYGAPGEFSPTFTPGSRVLSDSWVDGDGHLWLYGSDRPHVRSDLWKFNTQTLQWARMKPSGPSVPQVGEKGVPAETNNPGVRYTWQNWKDSAGDLWLFGGEPSALLWRYTAADNNWTWEGGTTTTYQLGHYGVFQTASPLNAPGSRWRGQAWVDAGNNFWLFGGMGMGETGPMTQLGDMWRLDDATKQWAWMAGPKSGPPALNPGIKGVPSATNHPGPRVWAQCWTGKDGYLYMYGGQPQSGSSPRSDLWRFKPKEPLEAAVEQWLAY